MLLGTVIATDGVFTVDDIIVIIVIAVINFIIVTIVNDVNAVFLLLLLCQFSKLEFRIQNV